MVILGKWRYRCRSRRTAFAVAPIAIALAIVTGILVGASDMRADETLRQRQARVRAMSPTEKQDLLAKQDRFNRLTPEQRDRVTELHTELSSHPDAAKLNQVLDRYFVWLGTLPSQERAELLDLPPAERMERIRQLKAREEDRRLAELGLTANDARVLLTWFENEVEKHEEPLIQAAREDAATGVGQEREPADSRMNENERRGFLIFRTLWRGMDTLLALIPPEDVRRLVDQLSDSARNRYLSEPADQKQRLLTDWIRSSIRSRFRPPPVRDEDLLRMMPDLPPEDRAALEALPRERLYAELRKRYEMWRGLKDPRSFGRGRSGRRGEDFRGPPGRRGREGGPPGFGPPPPNGPNDRRGRFRDDRPEPPPPQPE